MKKLEILNPCNHFTQDYLNHLVKEIMSDDFSATKNKGVIGFLLDSCSAFIFNIVFSQTALNKPSIVFNILKAQHPVFSKIEYQIFYVWFKKFTKNIYTYKKNYFEQVEFFKNHVNNPFNVVDSNNNTTSNLIIDNSNSTNNTNAIREIALYKENNVLQNNFVSVSDIDNASSNSDTSYDELISLGVPPPVFPLNDLKFGDKKYPFKNLAEEGLVYDANGVIFDKFTSADNSKLLPVTLNLNLNQYLESGNLAWNYSYYQFSSLKTKTLVSNQLKQFYLRENRLYISSHKNDFCFYKIME